MNLTWQQIVGLFVLAIPIACVARTIVFEEVVREAREFCVRKSKDCRSLLQRKFFYLFTCEYCFSHYVTAALVAITRFQLMYEGWRGYLIAFFSLVFVANIYMNFYSRLRVEITIGKKEAEAKAKEVEKLKVEIREKCGYDPEARDGDKTPIAAGNSTPSRQEDHSC